VVSNFAQALKTLRLDCHFHYYKDSKGEWRWRLKASNGRILADSGQGYSSGHECLEDIKRVKGSADAPVKKDETTCLTSGVRCTQQGEAERFPPRAITGCAGKR
jgi:uncharacterized protein YegP (UPF0339 family)